MKNFLILDLDETMVHTFPDEKGYDVAKKLPQLRDRLYNFTLDGQFMWGIIRPYALDFISNLQKHYHIGVWSAGTKDYVSEIVKLLFIKTPPIFVCSRDYCDDIIDFSSSTLDHIKIKPLSKLYLDYPSMNRTNTVILDDRSDVCCENPINHLHIPKYDFQLYSNPSDFTKSLLDDNDIILLSLSKYLISVRDTKDVRFITGFLLRYHK